MKYKKSMAKILIFLLLFPFVFAYKTNKSYAVTEYESHLTVAYYECWQDPTTKEWKYDDKDGRHTFPGPGVEISKYPFGLYISEGFKLHKLEVYEKGKTYENLKRHTTIPDKDIFDHILNPIALVESEKLVGATGDIKPVAYFRIPSTDRAIEYTKEGSTVPVYRYYLPVVMIVEKIIPETNPKITITGEVNPNPSTLVNGKADVQVKVNAKVVDLGADTPKTWELYYQKPDGNWESVTKETGSTDVVHTYGATTITKDTIFPLKAVLRTTQGKDLMATGEVRAYTVQGGDDGGGENEIIAKLKGYVDPRTIEYEKSDFDADIPQTVELTLDALGSSVTAKPAEFLFYYRVNSDRGWKYADGWVKDDEYVFNDVEVYPSDFDSKGELEISCRVSVKNGLGNVAYASDRAVTFRKIIVAPPEHTHEGPQKCYPVEVTSTSALKNVVNLTYFSKDDIPFKEYIVSLYKYNPAGDTWQPVYENKHQTSNTVEITGSKSEEFLLKSIAVDELGTQSTMAESTYVIENASPTIKLTLDPTNVTNNKALSITVENLTPTEIESIYPTSYTRWELIDAKGNLLASGSGQAPKTIQTDARYDGTVVTAIQYAKNTLNNTARGIDRYSDYSIIDFTINPGVLYETELTTVTDLSKAITEKVWEIKNVNDAGYQPLVMDEEMKFTKSKGKYTVKQSGNGKFGINYSDYQYANNRQILRNDPTEITDMQVKASKGDNVDYVVKSTEWADGIEQGSFNANGTNYKYRRKISFMGLKTESIYETKPVEFKNGKPVAFLEILADDYKVFKKVVNDGSKSVDATDLELQAKYPIDFSSDRTQLILEPLDKLGGNPVYSKNAAIKGIDKEIEDGKVVFKGKQIQEVRYDLEGVYRASYKVFNGLMDSDWVTEEFFISPDLPPNIDIKVGESVTHRDADNELKSSLHAIVDYSSPDGDQIDLDKSKLFISFDANNDGNFENDGVDSSQWIMKDSQSLQSYLSINNRVFAEERAIVSVGVDNPEKNVLGRFKFEFEAIEKPAVAHFELFGEVPTLKADTFDLDLIKKLTTIENHKPVITLETERWKTLELNWIDETGNEPTEQYVRELFEIFEMNHVDMRTFTILKLDGTQIKYEKKDGVITSRIIPD